MLALTLSMMRCVRRIPVLVVLHDDKLSWVVSPHVSPSLSPQVFEDEGDDSGSSDDDVDEDEDASSFGDEDMTAFQ